MSNMMRKIMKYKWILATILVIYLFFHFFMRQTEGFDCTSVKKQSNCEKHSQCSWGSNSTRGGIIYTCKNA